MYVGIRRDPCDRTSVSQNLAKLEPRSTPPRPSISDDISAQDPQAQADHEGHRHPHNNAHVGVYLEADGSRRHNLQAVLEGLMHIVVLIVDCKIVCPLGQV